MESSIETLTYHAEGLGQSDLIHGSNPAESLMLLCQSLGRLTLAFP